MMYCATPGVYTNKYLTCVHPFCVLENGGVSKCYTKKDQEIRSSKPDQITILNEGKFRFPQIFE